MRRTISSALIVALGVLGTPIGALAASAQQGPATVNGKTLAADKTPLPNFKVQIRNKAGNIAATTTSTEAGTFSLPGLPAGDYVIEILDAANRVVGLSPSIAVAAGATVTVDVTSAVAGALLAATTGGVSLFGLGKLATIGLLSAAGVATVAGVVVAKKDASPSK